MIECEATTRKWGNSLGITLPKELVEAQHLHENEKIKVLIMKQNHTFQKSFGMFKDKLGNKSTQQIKDELRAELYND